MKSSIIATLIVGLFHFSEGKPCPEETRAHATRCDSYFQCVVLPSKSHVWVPSQCERGLIYEPNLRLCVLPGDDWECTLGDTATTKKDENNVYGVNSLILKPDTLNLEANSNEKEVSTGDSNASNNSEEGDYIEVSNAIGISNDGSPLTASNQPSEEDSLEYSGDGNIKEERVELKDGGLEIQDSSKVDPKLSAQLQRLSQIIGGLKQKYQNQPDANLELRPDQLNAFLAHYNIRSQFDAINPSSFDKRPVPEDGRIEPEVLHHILKKQQMLQKSGLRPNNSVTTTPVSNGYVRIGTVPRPTASYNGNKIFLQNSSPEKHYRLPDGYSNSQIVVNKPEGSVLFSLPSNEQYQPRPTPDVNDVPRISEETLKTVLELSKQMITNQNIRQVLPSNAIYHSVVQPMYFPFPMSGSQQGNFYSDKYQMQSGYSDDENYQMSSQKKPIRDHKRKPSETVGQGNILPLTTSDGSLTGMIPRPIMSTAATGQNLNPTYQHQASDRIDSYGNKIVGNYQSPNEPDRTQFSSYQNTNGHDDSNGIYSTTLFPPLNYDLPPHVTPAAAQTPNPQYDSSYFNGYNTRPNQAPAYTTDPNLAHEMPKPISQSQMQFLLQRPQSPSNNRPQTLHPPESSFYNEIGSLPQPPQLRPINPTSVNIRPNSFQSSGAGFDTIDSEDDFADVSADSHFSYNQNNVNNMVVSDLLASNLDHSGSIGNSQLGNSQLVNLGGNFISYDVYKNQILPLFGTNAAGGSTNNVEVITCATGVRLPNATDCTKYYVCSKKDGKVLSYSCPPYTGFNAQTHICDARTYAFCNPQAIYNRFTVSENRKIQTDAMQALEEAKKVRKEAVQAQNLANLIRLETQKAINRTVIPQRFGLQNPTVLTNVKHTYHRNKPAQGNGFAASMMVMPTSRPHSQMTLVKAVKKSKKPRIRCSEGAKIPDPESVLHYYVCFKNSEGKLKRRKMECSAGLMFCDKTMLCTLPRRCNA